MLSGADLPYPNSWYALAFSDELRPGAVLTRRLAGQDLVIFRTARGVACVTDAYCPHLGAHLGMGGDVVGEELRCPFHHFRFNTAGVCTATGYGTRPPPKARLRTWPLREQGGIIFVYYDSLGQAPQWTPPDLSGRDWTPLIHQTLDLRDHPQETVENGVDIGHFAIIHGYSHVRVRRELVMDGPSFTTGYAARRPMPFLGRLGLHVDFEFDLRIFGLGCSIVETHVPRYDLRSRLFIMATPTEPGQIKLNLALSLRRIERPERIHPLLKLAPRHLLERLAARTIFDGLVNDVRQDLVIWEHKRYVQPPALAEGDGPIGRYRQWCRQFYHAEGAPASRSPVPDETAATYG
jgi:nitrite reductase/ring-hydroxylating ferredoxin subunit